MDQDPGQGWRQSKAGPPAIILVGVVHGDPTGYDKLTRLFDLVRPWLISLEISPFSWHYRRRWQASWQRQFRRGLQALPPQRRQHLALCRVAAQIAMPFEVAAAQDYGLRHGVAWQAVDINALARQHLPLFRTELLSAENLGALALTEDGDWDDHIRREYRRARYSLQTGNKSGIVPRGVNRSPQAGMREKVLAQRVARLARRWRWVVHVGGWEHLLRSGPEKTMADFLAALRPQRLLLDEDLTIWATGTENRITRAGGGGGILGEGAGVLPPGHLPWKHFCNDLLQG